MTKNTPKQPKSKIEVIKICAASFLLRIEEADISWIFNAWPDIAKFMIQRDLSYNGIVYPDLKLQTEKGISCNLVEFPLLHAMFNQGMYFDGIRPMLIGSRRQLELGSESFRRGMFGFYDESEMKDCDLLDSETEELMNEIRALSLNGIQKADELLELLPLTRLEDCPTLETATEYNGVRIWKEAINVFGIEYQGEQVFIDCNLKEGEEYIPPLKIDVKNIPYRLFQVIDTGEEDGFSPKSCMHTLIQWRSKIVCIDLPMNVPYLLEKVSISRTEIDAVLFTHNHDDHIGELSMLMHMDKKVTVICPKIIWKSILLKASAMMDMDMQELSEFFNHVPIRYGQEFDYCGLHITAHPSIHPVPCAIYKIRAIVNGEWKSYGHMSDILNYTRCQKLVDDGHFSQKRFDDYKAFLQEPLTVKKIDVGTKPGGELFSVHGHWEDFVDDESEQIVLGHIREEFLPVKATVLVGQIAFAGSARNMGTSDDRYYQDKHRERAFEYLYDYLHALLEERLKKGYVSEDRVLEYAKILSDNEIQLIQANSPFLKMGGDSTFVDMVISGTGSIWIEKDDTIVKITNVNAGDLIGDMGVLREIPRTATVRADSYLYVLRIPGLLFKQAAMTLGIFSGRLGWGQDESVLEKIWRHRVIVQGSGLFSAEIPIYIQNKIAQYADEVVLGEGDYLCQTEDDLDTLWVSDDANAFKVEIDEGALPKEFVSPPVFGEATFYLGKKEEDYRVMAKKTVSVLKLDRENFDWILDVPIFKMRLKQLVEKRNILVERALKKG